jgi:Beta-lactamase
MTKAAPVSEKLRAQKELRSLLAAADVEPEFTELYLKQVKLVKTSKINSYFPKSAETSARGPVWQEPRPAPVLLPTRNLDADAFVSGLHNDLVALPICGYTLRVRRDGVTTHTMIWNWARRPQDPAELGWKPDIKMHVASVSKLVTAMAMVKLLRDKGVSYDALVSPYLPSYLSMGPNLGGLTFRQLLSHRSGFRQPSKGLPNKGGPNGGYDYRQFKTLYATGVKAADVGQYEYHNGNFITLRVALSVLTGLVDRNEFSSSVIPDESWDVLSTAYYMSYARKNVLLPSFCQADIVPPENGSLGYAPDLSLNGMNANAMASAGTAGWWFSVDEIMNIMNTFWQSNAIVPKTVARRALREGLTGEDPMGFQFHRGVPDCFIKGGYWEDGVKKTTQCVVVFAPRNVEIAVFVNSPIPGNNITAYVANRLAPNLK